MTLQEAVLKYIALQEYQKQIDEEKKLVGEFLRNHMGELGAKMIKMPQGTFSTVERKRWKYSDLLEADMESIKLAKKEEEKNGTATFVGMTIGIAFKPKKQK